MAKKTTKIGRARRLCKGKTGRKLRACLRERIWTKRESCRDRKGKFIPIPSCIGGWHQRR